MIILFAPAKTFREGKSANELKLNFESKTQNLIQEIKSWDLKEIKERFSISDNVAQLVQSYYQHYEEAKNTLAFSLFYGPSFQAFHFDGLNVERIQYLNERVLILDALYGVIRPLDGIKPYRLDFQTKKMNLVSYWKSDINQYLRDRGCNVVLSLASDEFTTLVDKDLDVVRVRFLDDVDGTFKLISVFNKQMRGKLLRVLVEKEASSLEDLPQEIDGYSYSKERSTPSTIVYVRKTL